MEPGRKGLFEKSPLESQKLHKNKLVWSVGNSFAYFSYKKSRRKVSWNFKSFRQNKLVRSVGNSFAYFSYKKSRRGGRNGKNII